MRNWLDIVSLVLSVIVPIILTLAPIFPIEVRVLVAILAVLMIFVVWFILRDFVYRQNISKVLRMINGFINALITFITENKIKDKEKYVTWGELRDVFLEAFSKVGREALNIHIEELRSTEEERRKKFLLQKAREGKITYEEALELKKLLEKQRQEYETYGNIAGAIIVGLIILFVIWLISQLSKESQH
mgnify:CR=1 FL=1